MERSPYSSSVMSVNSSRSPPVCPQPQPPSVRRLLSANNVELRQLLSRRRELTELLIEARRENDLLRGHVQRSTADLDAATGESSDVGRALKKHAEHVRRIHDAMRANKKRERSTERRMKQKEAEIIKVQEDVKKNKELIDHADDLPEEDDLYNKLARVTNDITAKDNLIQDLHDQIHSLVSSHAAAVDKERRQHRERQRDCTTLKNHIDHLKLQIKSVDKELANGLVYTQTAVRLAQGHGVEDDESKSEQSAPEHGSTLTLQQKIKQFDNIRRKQWQNQVEKELRRKCEAAERKRRLEEEEERLCQLEEERLILEEEERGRERERMRREAERIKELELERNRRMEEQQRRLAEAMLRAKEERERKLEEEAERIAHEDEQRQQKLYRELVQKETDAQLRRQNRWYYEGGKVDWQEDHQRSAGDVENQRTTSPDSQSHSSRVVPVNADDKTGDVEREGEDRTLSPPPEQHSPGRRKGRKSPRCGRKACRTSPRAKAGQRANRRRHKSPAKKSSTLATETHHDDVQLSSSVPEVVKHSGSDATTVSKVADSENLQS